MALSEQDIIATCAACWLATLETKDRLIKDDQLMRGTNQALAAAGLEYKAAQNVRHRVEVLIKDFGYNKPGINRSTNHWQA